MSRFACLLFFVPLFFFWLLYPAIPFHWDEIQFVLATARYDVRLHQPHPPGYFFFVLQGKLLANFTGDPYLAFQLLSTLYYSVSLALFYRLARHLGLPRAKETTFFFALSPLVIFHSLVGMSYMAEMAWALAFVSLGLQHLTRGGSFIYASAAIGVLGGVRQSGMVLLLPLYAYFWWRARWADRIGGLAVTLSFFGLALVSMASLSGGWEGYRQAFAGQLSSVVAPLSVLAEPRRPFLNLLAILFLLGAGAPYFLTGLLGTFWPIEREAKRVLSLWFLPPLIFFLFVHFRNPGYLLLLFPPYALWMGGCARTPKALARLFTIGWVLVHVAILALVPLPFTHAALREHDRLMQRYVLEVEQKFPQACIVTRDYFYYGFRHAQILFPRRTIVQVYPRSLYAQQVLCHEEYGRPCPPLEDLVRLCHTWITLQDPASPPWTPKGFPLQWTRHDLNNIFFFWGQTRKPLRLPEGRL